MNHHYTPCAALWYTKWQYHIRQAHELKSERDGYCHAALIAQTMYVIHLALKT